jgi:hypothetical protein
MKLKSEDVDGRIPNKILNRKFHNIRSVQQPRTRRGDIVHRDALQIIQTPGWRRRDSDE